MFEPLWFPFDSARWYLFVVGTLTALVSGLTAQVRADRKGGIAGATSGTVGLLYIVLAFGYTDAALVLAGAHAVQDVADIACTQRDPRGTLTR